MLCRRFKGEDAGLLAFPLTGLDMLCSGTLGEAAADEDDGEVGGCNFGLGDW